MRLSPYLNIGIIVKPQGIKGEVKVKPLTSDPHRFSRLKQLFFCENGAYSPIKIQNCRVQADLVYLKLDGIDTRNQAELLRGMELFIDRAHAAPLPPGKFYLADLLGCTVSLTDGRTIGTVTDIQQNTSVDVYAIEGTGQQWLVPIIPQLLTHVDVQAGEILMDSHVFDSCAVDSIS